MGGAASGFLRGEWGFVRTRSEAFPPDEDRPDLAGPAVDAFPLPGFPAILPGRVFLGGALPILPSAWSNVPGSAW